MVVPATVAIAESVAVMVMPMMGFAKMAPIHPELLYCDKKSKQVS